MEQSEGKFTPLGLGAAAAVIAVTLVALVALAGLLPLNRPPKTQETLAPTAIPREPVGNAARHASTTEGPAAAGLCTTCGIVESVRAFEVRGEATGAGKTVAPTGRFRTRSPPDTASARRFASSTGRSCRAGNAHRNHLGRRCAGPQAPRRASPSERKF
jgi:hypothetical protein